MATITTFIDRVRSIFTETFDGRAAPDDVILMDVSLGVAPDEDDEDGGDEAVVIFFVSVQDEFADGGAIVCTCRIPVIAIADQDRARAAADALWDIIQGKRMGRALEAMGLGSGAEDDTVLG